MNDSHLKSESVSEKIILLLLSICNEYGPFSRFHLRISFLNCVSRERNFQFLFFEFCLVILKGTFSDDMITTGMFFSKMKIPVKWGKKKIQSNFPCIFKTNAISDKIPCIFRPDMLGRRMVGKFPRDFQTEDNEPSYQLPTHLNLISKVPT